MRKKGRFVISKDDSVDDVVAVDARDKVVVDLIQNELD
jgi:hypothetical protein